MSASAPARVVSRSARRAAFEVTPQVRYFPPKFRDAPLPRFALTPLVQLPSHTLQVRTKIVVMVVLIVIVPVTVIMTVTVTVTVTMTMTTVIVTMTVCGWLFAAAGIVALVVAALAQLVLQILDVGLQLLDLLLEVHPVRLSASRCAVGGAATIRLAGCGGVSFGHGCSPTTTTINEDPNSVPGSCCSVGGASGVRIP
jgi:hypothetical protein